MSTGPSLPSNSDHPYFDGATAHVDKNLVWRQDCLSACVDANWWQLVMLEAI